MASAAELLEKFAGTKVYPKIKGTIKIMEKALDVYGPSNLALSFNGGKDCLVLLDIYAELLKDRAYKGLIRSLYIKSHDPFAEVDEFIETCTKKYPILIEEYTAELKVGLASFLDNNPSKGILIGTRRGDPFSSSLLDFQDTDGDWPKITRVHPILEWEYCDIWEYLQTARVEYCVLYDQGYTSLGGRGNTIPNPDLKNDNGTFKPAYLLRDGTRERCGRITLNK
jgi:FAD synthetase